MTKIDVVSGFLGAGKTTLIKKLLKEALDGSKTVLIEQEKLHLLRSFYRKLSRGSRLSSLRTSLVRLVSTAVS